MLKSICEETSCKVSIDEDLEGYSAKLLENIRKGQIAGREGYVYLIKCGRTKYYKIGLSTVPSLRFAHLQHANPFKLELIKSVKVANCGAVEKSLHRKFALKRVRGEWFKLTKNNIEHIVGILHDNEIW